jgi:uncharacterized protein
MKQGQHSAVAPTVLIVPGLREHVAAHWQTLLGERLSRAGTAFRCVPPMGREDLDCQARVNAIEREIGSISGPVVVVAHSGGCIMLAHWARQSKRALLGALLATPPDFETAMPEGYPSRAALAAAGWLPVPRERLPFRSIVAASRNDPLGSYQRVSELASSWGSELVDLRKAGHLNPASGFGEWPRADAFIEELSTEQ